MTRTTKRSAHLLGKSVLFGVVALVAAGCVADPYPGYYNTYPNDYSYYDATGQTVVIVRDRDYPYYRDGRHYDDYDNKWRYGRRGNANYHGTDRDNRHED